MSEIKSKAATLEIAKIRGKYMYRFFGGEEFVYGSEPSFNAIEMVWQHVAANKTIADWGEGNIFITVTEHA